MSEEKQKIIDEELNNNSIEQEYKERDLVEMAQILWSARRTIIKVALIAAILGIIVAFSIPKEYTTTIKLAPELEKSSNSRGLSALANLAGISAGSSGTSDAVNPTLYPDVIESVPFIVDLFDMPVTDSKGKLHTTLFEYIKNHNSVPWWRTIFNLPTKTISGIKSQFSSNKVMDSTKIDPFKLTPIENTVRKTLRNRIGINVDTKTTVIEISVTMQDPLISALVADTVVSNLKTYVTNYRTDKARQDLEYATKLNEEAKEDYFEAQQAYADYVDRNHGIAFNSRRIEETRLQNDVQLKYNLYDQTSQRVQMAKAKVQENTPVYAVLQPATVPLSPSKPRKFKTLITFVFLGVVGASVWILFGSEFISKFKKTNKSSKENIKIKQTINE